MCACVCGVCVCVNKLIRILSSMGKKVYHLFLSIVFGPTLLFTKMPIEMFEGICSR